MEEWRNSTTIF